MPKRKPKETKDDPTSDTPASTPAVPPLLTDWRLVTRLQLGELLGVHPDTVTDYARQGMPVVTRGGQGKEGVYDAVLCAAWWRDQQGANAKEAAQARAFSASAELNELKLQRERGDVVATDQVVLEGQAYTKGWVAKVRGFPRRLTQAGIIERKLEPRVAAICRELLTEISGWRTIADALRAARKAS